MANLKMLLPLCAAVLLAGPMGNARADDFNGSLDWTGFSVLLTDLDVSDGVDPSLTWLSQSTGASVLGAGGATVNNWGPILPASPLVFSNGLVTASAGPDMLGISGSGLHSGMGFLEAVATRYGDFTLSAQTRVDFTLPASVLAAAPAGVEILLGASMVVTGPLGAGFNSDEIGVGPGDAQARDLQVSFSNLDVVADDLHFSSALNVNAYPAAPIPEPGQLAMLIAGLGVVALSLRHRRCG